MEKLSRKAIFARAAEKLRADFEELRNIPHPGLKGSEGEGILRDFLNKHLPKRFGAGAGFIIDGRDQVSRQTDVVIYDALNCPLYRESENASIYPNDNIAAVIEVKSNLDKDRLRDSAEKIFAVKGLAKRKPPELPFLIQFETLGIVFAFSSPLTLDKVAEHYRNIIVKQGGLSRHIDFIFILDKGMICLSARIKGDDGWAPAFILGPGGAIGEGSHIAIGCQELGRGTLDAFLRILLAHLQFFRGIIDHPGFNWSQIGGSPARLTYLTSITYEKDPAKKREKLEKYKEEVRKEFGNI